VRRYRVLRDLGDPSYVMIDLEFDSVPGNSSGSSNDNSAPGLT
jgi:hypothetical protein